MSPVQMGKSSRQSTRHEETIFSIARSAWVRVFKGDGGREELQRWVKDGRTSCEGTRRRMRAGRATESFSLYL